MSICEQTPQVLGVKIKNYNYVPKLHSNNNLKQIKQMAGLKLKLLFAIIVSLFSMSIFNYFFWQ